MVDGRHFCEGLHRPCPEHENNKTVGCHDCPPQTDAELCYGCQRKLRKALDRLIYDYCLLFAWIARPIQHHGGGRSQPRPDNARVFGHPGEWASDTMRAIAGCLWSWEDNVRDHLEHSPVASPGRAESRVIGGAYKYLVSQFDTFADFPGSLTALRELTETHGKLYSDLGRSREIRRLPTPCPDCGMTGTLLWTVDFDRDAIVCQTPDCGRQIRPEHYLMYARIVIDDLMDQADQEEAS